VLLLAIAVSGFGAACYPAPPLREPVAVPIEVAAETEDAPRHLRFIQSIGERGWRDVFFKQPSAVTLDSRARILVADTGNNRVQNFAREGTFLKYLGTKGLEPGQFRAPSSLAIDSRGRIKEGSQSDEPPSRERSIFMACC